MKTFTQYKAGITLRNMIISFIVTTFTVILANIEYECSMAGGFISWCIVNLIVLGITRAVFEDFGKDWYKEYVRNYQNK